MKYNTQIRLTQQRHKHLLGILVVPRSVLDVSNTVPYFIFKTNMKKSIYCFLLF